MTPDILIDRISDVSKRRWPELERAGAGGAGRLLVIAAMMDGLGGLLGIVSRTGTSNWAGYEQFCVATAVLGASRLTAELAQTAVDEPSTAPVQQAHSGFDVSSRVGDKLISISLAALLEEPVLLQDVQDILQQFECCTAKLVALGRTRVAVARVQTLVSLFERYAARLNSVGQDDALPVLHRLEYATVRRLVERTRWHLVAIQTC